jgi:hypothetical protein
LEFSRVFSSESELLVPVLFPIEHGRRPGLVAQGS